MSVEASAQVWKLDLPRDQKIVLMAFADHANDTGYTYPSLARVAWKCGYQQARTVSNIVQKLLDSGVLEMLEKAHGRTPTLYRIHWERGPQLPEFDPGSFSPNRAKGAENAPLGVTPNSAESGDAKSLTAQGENHPLGAENAPHGHALRKTHPKETVGVRFDNRKGAFLNRKGAVASAPEPLTINQRGAGARASESRPPTPEPSGADARLLALNNSARLLRIEPKTPNETLAHFSRRVDAAHGRQLATTVEQQRERATRAEAEREGQAGATG